MPRELHALIGGQPGVDLATQRIGLPLEVPQLIIGLYAARLGVLPKLTNPLLQLEHRFFEIEPARHAISLDHRTRSVGHSPTSARSTASPSATR